MADFSEAALRRVLAHVERTTQRRAEQFIKAVTLEGERQVKLKVAEGGSHRKGTPTPAVRGGGPAIVTGNLRRNVASKSAGTRGAVGITGGARYGKHLEADGFVVTSALPKQIKDDIVPRLKRVHLEARYPRAD